MVLHLLRPTTYSLLLCVLLQVGLRKLLDAEGEVNVMKQELIALQPKLIETGAQLLLGGGWHF